MPFYLDVYAIDNLIIHYALLWTVMKCTKTKTSNWRILLGACLGTLYSILYAFIEYIPRSLVLYSILARIAFSMILIAVTFNIPKWREFIRVFLVFYVVNFVFAGAAFGLFYFTRVGTYSNGIFYIKHFPLKTLFTSIFISYVVLKISWNIVMKRISKEKLFMGIDIFYNQRKVTVNALVDTGNALADPITQTPVIIAEFQAIKDFLPDEVKLLFYEKKDQDLTCIMGLSEYSGFCNRIRMIPFSSLGKQNGMLVGFRPDKIEFLMQRQQKVIDNVIIGIYNYKLSKDDSYEALLHPDIIQ